MNSPSSPGELVELAKTLTGPAARSDNAERYAKLSTRLHIVADTEIAKVSAEAPPAACAPKCCFCCHGIVPVTFPEMVELNQVISSWHPEERQALLARSAEYLKASEAYWRDETTTVDADCPFLVDQLCTVYENRPLTCRSRNSYDAGICARLYFGERILPPMVPGQLEVGQALTNGMVEALKQEGRTAGIFELGAATHHLLTGNMAALARARVDTQPDSPPAPIDPDAYALLEPPLVELLGSDDPKLQTDPLGRYHVAMRLADKSDLSVLFRLTFPGMYDSEEMLEEWWQRYQDNVDLLCSLNLDPKLAFEAIGYIDLFLLAYNGKNIKPVAEQLMTYLHEQVARPAHPGLTAPFERRRPGKFRLGYASYRLNHYNGSRWALGWIKNQNPEIETYAFNLNPTEDLVSAKWRHFADRYLHLPYRGVQAARVIREFDLDALILTDVGEDGVTLQLSLLRLARHQFTSWGHAVTSGSPTMDYYLTSVEMEPPNGDEHYTEKLIRLPGSAQTLAPGWLRPSDKAAPELGLPEGGFYLVSQTPAKLLPRRDHVLAEISQRTEKPIVVCGTSDPNSKGERVRQRLERAGAKAVAAPWLSIPDFLRMLQLADCTLDTFDFTGGMTTIDSMSLGAPIVSCPGEFMRGRMSLPFIEQAGMGALITNNEAEYVELACDLERIQAAKEDWNPAPMFGDLRPVRALEEFLLSL